ncbi:unnamed protein product [Citrullus colocynthis]|uniref:Transmembrane protein n=1 Tax=Citrullus colocynthis TaxID=252529 RepID=A0ABP0YG01_9ROSI
MHEKRLKRALSHQPQAPSTPFSSSRPHAPAEVGFLPPPSATRSRRRLSPLFSVNAAVVGLFLSLSVSLTREQKGREPHRRRPPRTTSVRRLQPAPLVAVQPSSVLSVCQSTSTVA